MVNSSVDGHRTPLDVHALGHPAVDDDGPSSMLTSRSTNPAAVPPYLATAIGGSPCPVGSSEGHHSGRRVRPSYSRRLGRAAIRPPAAGAGGVASRGRPLPG